LKNFGFNFASTKQMRREAGSVPGAIKFMLLAPARKADSRKAGSE
jgi:hypothetical protein